MHRPRPDSPADASAMHIGWPVYGHGISVATAASKMVRCSASLWQPPLVLEYRMYSTGDPTPMPATESLSELVPVPYVCEELLNSARTVPGQCPDSARTVPGQCPMGKTRVFQNLRVLK